MTINSNPALEVNQIPSSIDIPKDYEEFRQVMSLYLKRIADASNKKEGSLYYLQEIGNFVNYFTPGIPYQFRQGYRYVFDLVSLNAANIPASGSVTFPHGIVGLTNGTLIYVTATTTTGLTFTATYPYSSMDGTDIYFTNPTAITLSAAYFVANYLKE